jgi:protein arginine N-methyltransferase 1
MLEDVARTTAFKSAIDAVVQVGSRVLDLGSGTGVLSFFAGQRAEKVIAVEYNPALVKASRIFLDQNGLAQKVLVQQGDAATFTPDEPVDVVICEMLHSALLREKQIDVIAQFKSRYLARFNNLPLFIPEATILAAQPVIHDFDFHGFKAAVPLFQDAASKHARSLPVADAKSYATVDYRADLPKRLEISLQFAIKNDSQINAIRFITKNLLAILSTEMGSIDWFNQHLVLPLNTPCFALAGSTLTLRFSYDVGGSIESLVESMSCHV